MLKLFFKSYIVVILLAIHNVYGLDPLVETSLGLIKGLRAEDGQYYMFMGIPYGTVNDSNPFGPSTPYGPFNETFEAYDDSAICPQIEEFDKQIRGSLDCLQLNVYVPNSATKANPLPVLVWIYGGGFSIGFAGRYLYGPKYLVRHEIILVTVNYRLGPYGFMCTPDVPGNQGLKDQHLALKWIKENIASFGGNPDRITLFGESAGSISIDYHFHSPQEKLFNNVILQSGTTYSPGLLSEASEEGTLKLANHLGFATDNVDEAISFLAKTDSDLVIAAASQINYRFLPCIERGDNADKFIPDYPINTGIPKVKNTPVLIGYNADEQLAAYVHASAEYLAGLNLFYNKLNAELNLDADELNDLEALVRRFYIGDAKINEDVREAFGDFDSDWMFNHPTHRSIDKYIKNDADNVFFYVFAYNGSRNYVKMRVNTTIGSAFHADEIGYLFDISYMVDVPSNDDQKIIDRLTSMWANFVKYSNPTPSITDLLPVKWEPVTVDSLNYLNIDTNLTLGNRPFNKRSTFWDLFFYYNTKNIKGYKNTSP